MLAMKVSKWTDNIGDLTSESPYTGVNEYLYLSQKATMEKDSSNNNNTSDDDNAPKSLTVLEFMGPIQSKMIALPSSLQSEAHKNLTLAVRQRNMKKARIAEYVTVDPEKEKLDRIKNKEDFNGQRQQRHQKQRGQNNNNKGGMGGRRRRYQEDEEDDRYDNVNLSRLKRRQYEDEEVDYGRESDEEESDWYKRKKDARSKPNRSKRRYSDDDDSYEEQRRGGNATTHPTTTTTTIHSSHSRIHNTNNTTTTTTNISKCGYGYGAVSNWKDVLVRSSSQLVVWNQPHSSSTNKEELSLLQEMLI